MTLHHLVRRVERRAVGVDALLDLLLHLALELVNVPLTRLRRRRSDDIIRTTITRVSTSCAALSRRRHPQQKHTLFVEPQDTMRERGGAIIDSAQKMRFHIESIRFDSIRFISFRFISFHFILEEKTSFFSHLEARRHRVVDVVGHARALAILPSRADGYFRVVKAPHPAMPRHSYLGAMFQ